MTGIWDVHNHMLPALDDGADCTDESIDMLKAAYQQGVRNIIFTPHYRRGMVEPSVQKRQDAYVSFLSIYEEYLKSDFPGMTFQLGCEYHMHPFSELPRVDVNSLCMSGTRVILTEFDWNVSLYNIKRALRPLLEAGYTCIIAHVEYCGLNFKEIRELSNIPNVLIQVNADSLLGMDGFLTKQLARKLLRKGCVDLIGSDAHNTGDRACHLGQCAQWITKKYGSNFAHTLLIENPESIFNSKQIEYPATFWTSFGQNFGMETAV